MGIVLTGIAMVDLTETAPEILDEIVSISGVAAVLFSTRTASLLGRIGMEGCADILVLPNDTVFVRGTSRMDAAFLSSLPRQTSFYVDDSGTIVLGADVGAELLQQAVARILGDEGIVVCPPALRGTVELLRRASANIVVGADTVTRGRVVLDAERIERLQEGSRLLHVGTLSALAPVSTELLRARLASLEVRGSLVVRATTYAAIKDRIVAGEGCSLEVVPDDARYVVGDLTLDTAFLESSTGGPLWVTDSVVVAKDVSEAALAKAVSTLRAKEVLCPGRLAAVVVGLTRGAVTPELYRDDLIAFQGRYELEPAELEFRGPTVAIRGEGLLVMHAELSPEVIESRVEYIAVSGVVECSGHQVGAVKAKVRGPGAMVRNRDQPKSPAAEPSQEPAQEQHRAISGVAHVKL